MYDSPSMLTQEQKNRRDNEIKLARANPIEYERKKPFIGPVTYLKLLSVAKSSNMPLKMVIDTFYQARYGIPSPFELERLRNQAEAMAHSVAAPVETNTANKSTIIS